MYVFYHRPIHLKSPRRHLMLAFDVLLQLIGLACGITALITIVAHTIVLGLFMPHQVAGIRKDQIAPVAGIPDALVPRLAVSRQVAGLGRRVRALVAVEPDAFVFCLFVAFEVAVVKRHEIALVTQKPRRESFMFRLFVTFQRNKVSCCVVTQIAGIPNALVNGFLVLFKLGRLCGYEVTSITWISIASVLGIHVTPEFARFCCNIYAEITGVALDFLFWLWFLQHFFSFLSS